MERKFIFVITLFAICLVSSSFNINLTSINYIMSTEARMLLGVPTSQFPRESFINFLLYGHTDVNFTYQDFISSYGSKTNITWEGYLIIGNDLKLGGMVMAWGDVITVAVPIPGSTITNVPLNQLNKYFPNGYTILESKSMEYTYGNGRENSSFNNQKICENCYAGFSFADDLGVDIFQPNFFYLKWAFSNIRGINFEAYGYLKQFESKTNNGLVKIYSYMTEYQGSINHYFTDDRYSNFYNISTKDRNNFTYKGSLWAEIANSSQYYNFSGYWAIRY